MTSQPSSPSLLLKIVIIKKALFAVFLLVVSAISAFSWRNYDQVAVWANDYLVNGEYGLVHWVLETVTNSQTATLKLVARVSGAYGLLVAIATTGLWFGKRWADPLFITLVGLLLPVEVYEIVHHASWSKFLLFAINLLIFGVLITHWVHTWDENTADGANDQELKQAS